MKTFDERPFIGMRNLDKAHKLHKSVTITVIVIIPVIIISFLVFLSDQRAKQTDTMYVQTVDGISIAKKVSVEENRPLECKKHIMKFYHAFLDLDPYEASITASMEEAYHYGGEVIKDMVSLYKENGVFNKYIMDNVRVRCMIKEEDIEVNANVYPYEVSAKGKQYLIRKSTIEARNFNIKCTMRNLKFRTLENIHALWIMDIMHINNETVEITDYEKAMIRKHLKESEELSEFN